MQHICCSIECRTKPPQTKPPLTNPPRTKPPHFFVWVGQNPPSKYKVLTSFITLV